MERGLQLLRKKAQRDPKLDALSAFATRWEKNAALAQALQKEQEKRKVLKRILRHNPKLRRTEEERALNAAARHVQAEQRRLARYQAGLPPALPRTDAARRLDEDLLLRQYARVQT